MAQKFILQMLVALFAEDIGLLPKYFVTQVLEEHSTSAKAHGDHHEQPAFGHGNELPIAS